MSYFKEFILFQKIISNYKADASKTKQNDSELKSFLIIHPEKNQILNLSEERTSDKEPKSEGLISLNHQNSEIEKSKLNKSNILFENKFNSMKDSKESKKINNTIYQNKSANEGKFLNISEKNKSKKSKNLEKKDMNKFDVEKVEMSNGNSYESNAIDFIKYVLFASSLEKDIIIPDQLKLEFNDKLLNIADIKERKSIKDSIKFDLVVKDLTKKELKEFLDILNNNIFLKEKLNLENYADNKKFDLLIEVAKNYFFQSQDKFFQLKSYTALIKILNFLDEHKALLDSEGLNDILDKLDIKNLSSNSHKKADIFEKDKEVHQNPSSKLNEKSEKKNEIEYKKLYEDIYRKLKLSKGNVKVFILITDGSYHLLSQIIKFSKDNKYEELINMNFIDEKDYSFDYNNDIDKILSTLIKNTSISKIFSYNKNNRNIHNFNKFLEILSTLEKYKIPHCIIYYEDDIKISMDNQILNELILLLKYNKSKIEKDFKGKFEALEKKIKERDYINYSNLTFKNKINEFINLLTTEEVQIKRLVNKYINVLDENEKINNIVKEIKVQFGDVKFFKKNILKIYLDKSNKYTSTIENYLKSIFTLESIYLNSKYEKYKNYLNSINEQISSWLNNIINRYSSYKNKGIYYFENGKLATNNILEVIQYNLNKYFDIEIKINKNNINLKDLDYDDSINEDKEFYDAVYLILNEIMKTFKEIFKKDIDIKILIKPLINNCKCYCLYSKIFESIIQFFCPFEKNNISNNILKILNN